MTELPPGFMNSATRASRLAELLDAVTRLRPVGVRDLAVAVGSVARRIDGDLRLLETAGHIVMVRPGGGYRDGERTVLLPGDPVPTTQIRSVAYDNRLAQGPAEQQRQRILALLSDGKSHSIYQIREQCELGLTTAHSRLRELGAAGRVARDGQSFRAKEQG